MAHDVRRPVALSLLWHTAWSSCFARQHRGQELSNSALQCVRNHPGIPMHVRAFCGHRVEHLNTMSFGIHIKKVMALQLGFEPGTLSSVFQSASGGPELPLRLSAEALKLQPGLPL